MSKNDELANIFAKRRAKKERKSHHKSSKEKCIKWLTENV
jgi:hypothetical protein